MRWVRLLGVAVLLVLWAGASVAQQPVGCAKYAEGPKREACKKREADLMAANEAKRQARAAKTREAQDRIKSACAVAPDRNKCVREETAKLKAKGAKGKDKPKKAN
jgi:hypothetical protein